MKQAWLVKQPQVNADPQEGVMTVQEDTQERGCLEKVNDSKENAQHISHVLNSGREGNDVHGIVCKGAKMGKQIEKGKSIDVNEDEGSSGQQIDSGPPDPLISK